MQNYDRVSTDRYGSKFYCLDDMLHRLDGPAVEYAGGSKSWYQNGKLHRFDGPAIEYADDSKHWFIGGEEYTFKGWLGEVWNTLSEDKKKEYIFGVFDEEL